MYSFNRYFLVILLPLLAVLSSCATMSNDMQVVQKNIEEGRVVSSVVVKKDNFINQYQHYPDKPGLNGVQLYIDTDRINMPANGGELLVQIGLQTEAPTIEETNIHLLLFNNKSTTFHGAFRQLGIATEAYIRQVGKQSEVTIDSRYKLPDMVGKTALLKSQSEDPQASLLAFLKPYVMLDYQNKHHIVLVVAADVELSMREQQNIVDMARILNAKGVSLSVLGMVEKANVALFNKMSYVAQGAYRPVTKGFNYQEWINAEVAAANVKTFTDVNLVAAFNDDIRVNKVIAPQNLHQRGQTLRINLPNIKQGQQQTVLLSLNLPAQNLHDEIDLLDLELRYFNPQKQQYVTQDMSQSIFYSKDFNNALPNRNATIRKTKLVLDTQKTLYDVERAVRNKRYYYGVSHLAKQSTRLKVFLQESDDQEIQRDAKILDAYAQQLMRFDEKTFQSFKIWKDLSLDKKRFTRHYQ